MLCVSGVRYLVAAKLLDVCLREPHKIRCSSNQFRVFVTLAGVVGEHMRNRLSVAVNVCAAVFSFRVYPNFPFAHFNLPCLTIHSSGLLRSRSITALGVIEGGAVNVSLFRYAFALILLSLIGGLFVPAMTVPRLGLSAHTIGVLGGVLLIAVGAIWQHFHLTSAQGAWLKWSWLYSSYINWFGCLVGAVLGAGRTTPIASGGYVGSDITEFVVSALLISVAIASFIAVGLSLWGLRRAP